MAAQRGRPRKVDFIQEAIDKLPKDELAEMPLNTLDEYLAYNAKAREFNKKLGVCRYKVKQCPEELHPKERVMIRELNQKNNPIPVYLDNEKICYRKKLKAGEKYDIPKCVVEHIQNKGTEIWERIDNPDGSWETKCTGLTPRFSVRTVAANV
jgi:hypothetical protein